MFTKKNLIIFIPNKQYILNLESLFYILSLTEKTIHFIVGIMYNIRSINTVWILKMFFMHFGVLNFVTKKVLLKWLFKYLKYNHALIHFLQVKVIFLIKKV